MKKYKYLEMLILTGFSVCHLIKAKRFCYIAWWEKR